MSAWVFHGDAQPLIDKAVDECTRDHGGKLTGEPSTFHASGKRDDGSSFPFTLVLVEEDSDGWWNEYATVHGWLDASKDGVARLYGPDATVDS